MQQLGGKSASSRYMPDVTVALYIESSVTSCIVVHGAVLLLSELYRGHGCNLSKSSTLTSEHPTCSLAQCCCMRCISDASCCSSIRCLSLTAATCASRDCLRSPALSCLRRISSKCLSKCNSMQLSECLCLQVSTCDHKCLLGKRVCAHAWRCLC